MVCGASRRGGAGARPSPNSPLSLGNPGDIKPVGEGVSELRIDYGPGYRLYFVARGREVVILLCGGDKRSQARDIKHALKLARELE
jgi:putative addiction module killer protein